MIDSHCHLNFPQLAADRAGVLQRAAAAGVSHLVNIGVTLEDSRAGVELAADLPQVSTTVGIHPCYDPPAGDFSSELRDLAQQPGVVAIGECGLDYFHDDIPRNVQRASFLKQLAVAGEVGLPVVIHSRESIGDCVAILRDFPQIEATFHCFTAGPAEVEQIIELGHYVGFTGPMTFKKSQGIRDAAMLVPENRVLVETDAPYLSPEPLRGKRPCEPAYVAHTLKRLAQVRGWGGKQADQITTDNTRRLFGLPA